MSGFSTSSYVSKSELALALLRLVIPGKHDPSLDDIEERGPKGGVRIKLAPGAFVPRLSFITTVINQNHTAIRHGRRRTYVGNSEYKKGGGLEIKPRTTRFYSDPMSPTLPDNTRVRRILWILNPNKAQDETLNKLKKIYRKQGAHAALEHVDLLIMTDRLEGK